MSDDVAKAMALWPADLQADFAENQFNPCVGQMLLSETSRVRVWSLSLKPGERIHFHRHVLDYFWTVLTDGKTRSHYHDGRILEVSYRAGDTGHMSFAEGEFMVHDLQNIGEGVIAYTTVEFQDSANAALPVPDHVRRQMAAA